jgi:hypothetical protein
VNPCHDSLSSRDMPLCAVSSLSITQPRVMTPFLQPPAIQLVERFYDPDGGQVLLDGVDLKDCNVRWLRQQVRQLVECSDRYPLPRCIEGGES